MKVALSLAAEEVHLVATQTRPAAEPQLVVGSSRSTLIVSSDWRRPRLIDVKVLLLLARGLTSTTPGAPVRGRRGRRLVVGLLARKAVDRGALS